LRCPKRILHLSTSTENIVLVTKRLDFIIEVHLMIHFQIINDCKIEFLRTIVDEFFFFQKKNADGNCPRTTWSTAEHL
jgi:hypothetical protein